MKQRVWKRHPGGGAIGEGISPERTIRSRGASPSIGTADSRLRVYGWSGSRNSSRAGPVSVTFPRYITATSSLTCRITRRSWETNRYAIPYSSWRSRRRLRICACTETSRADTGSSATTSFGESAIARAIPIRWRCPPENSWGYLSPASAGIPTRTSSRSARSRSAIPRASPWTSHPSPTMSRTLIRGLREEYGSWKTICISRRVFRSASPDRRVISLPSNRIAPASGSSRRIARRARVVFPHPDSPTSPSVLPGGTVRETPSTARTRRFSDEKNDFRTGNVL